MRTKWSEQEGSLVLALLASIIAGGLVVTVVATTITGQRGTREDRAYQTAINGADAAMQQAVSYISQLPDGDPPAAACVEGSPGAGCVISLESLGFDEALGAGATFAWSATQVNESLWQLRGSGLVGDVERVVEATIGKEAFFRIGAFGDKGVTARGSNWVRSFDALGSNTGRGSVGSNGEISLVGNARADIAALFGPATCLPNTNGCDPDNITINNFPDVFDVGAVYDAIDEHAAEMCETSDGTLTASAVSWERGRVYCYTSIQLPDDARVTLTGPTDESVVVFVDDVVAFGNRAQINCSPPTCLDDGTSRPDTGQLQIYSTGSEVRIGNQSQHAYALAAPVADCKGNPSNAQATIYGSMLCGDLTNQGGWNFVFDERLADLSMGAWQVTDWREEHANTSSF
jgi:Tfp pilus assembly protein PilX